MRLEGGDCLCTTIGGMLRSAAVRDRHEVKLRQTNRDGQHEADARQGPPASKG